MSFMPKKREVMFMDLATLRYQDFPIVSEEDKGFVTKKIERNINHFWKGGPGWTGKKLRYLGCKGHALTSWIKGVDEEAKGTVPEFLRFMWGNAYERLPIELRNLIENDVGVIVTVEPDLTEDDQTKYKVNRLQAEEMLADVTRKNLEPLGVHEEKKTLTGNLLDKIPWMAIGAFIIYILINNTALK